MMYKKYLFYFSIPTRVFSLRVPEKASVIMEDHAYFHELRKKSTENQNIV